MDEYLDSVPAVEQRIEFSVRNPPQAILSSVSESTIAAARPGIPADFREHIAIMMDLMVLAFQADATRVCSLMFANDVSGRNFSFLDGVSGSHHEL